jgi:hypothetical protein
MSKDTQLYATLRKYKWDPGTAQRQAAVRTVALIGRFLRDHRDCIVGAAGDDWDVITHVPSGSGRHPEPHPMVRCLEYYEPLHTAHVTLLERGPGAIARNSGADDGYRALPTADGKRVLLIDDTWTTGAHAQSAASALELGGAQVVAIVPVGRLIDPDRDADWWETQRRTPFDFAACCLD